MSPSISKGIAFFLSLGFIVSLSFFYSESSTTQTSVLFMKDYILLFFSGFIAAGAMVIPGLSGSFVLLILGTYFTILNAVSTYNLVIIGIVGMGALFGFYLCVRLINLFLHRYPSHTYYAILGLMIGSLFKIWPGFTPDLMGLISIVFAILGGVLAYYLS